MRPSPSPDGVGLGFRAALAEELLAAATTRAQFVEVAPENYLGVGGKRARWLHMAKERWPVVCHGLCGDLAGAAPLDIATLHELRAFLRDVSAHWYSDHLCFTNIAGHEVHDLLPLPFCDEAVARVATRVRAMRDVLELPIAVENVSAYLRVPGGTMQEPEFLRAVLEQADCQLLLDVNNVYVNAINFGFDPYAFIDAIPLSRVVQIHIAGHTLDDGGTLLIDTHGAPIVPPVYALLGHALTRLAALGLRPPVLLERDHNVPPLAELEAELHALATIVNDAPLALSEAADGPA